MDTYYTALDIPTTATVEEVEAAYERQRALYSPERVAALGAEFRQIAEARTAAIEQAYVVLSDAARRAEYDNQLNGAAPPARRAPSTGLSRREVLMAVGGAMVGLLFIALVWVVSSLDVRLPLVGSIRDAPLPPVGELNRPAPDFTLPGLNGQDVRLSDYRGKVVLINFWGTWCEPCKEETPALQQSYQKLRDQGLVIIGVDLRSQEGDGAEGVDNVRSFTERYGVTYPIALDIKGETARAFQIYPIPTSYFIDPNGTIRYVRVSTLTAEEVEVLFTKLRQATSALR